MSLPMASPSKPTPPRRILLLRSRSHSLLSLRPTFLPIFSSLPTSNPPRLVAVKSSAGAQGGRLERSEPRDPSLLRKPLVSSLADEVSDVDEESSVASDGDGDDVESRVGSGERGSYRKKKRRDEWVDWEDQILEDTVPLVGLVRMILHSGKYENGDRLSPEHEQTIMERLLPYHPEFEKKIGFGVDFITVGNHPDFENSRCLFIVRKDGEQVDFSYWKCIKGLIKKNYPLYADSFILRHFRRRRHE